MRDDAGRHAHAKMDSTAPERPAVRARAWLEILRAPNLLTVPGDPIAGALLAAGTVGGVLPWPAVVCCAAASLAIYAAGLLLNDVVDLNEDRRERPQRPLPSGRIPPKSAMRAALLLSGIGLTAAFAAGPYAGRAAIVLLAHVLAYDYLLKRTWLGAPVLGLCRGISLALGAFAVAPQPPAAALVAAGLLAAYVTAVSLMARRETAIAGRPALVGRLLGALPLIQAAFVLAARRPEGPVIAGALILAWFVAAVLRRRFSAS